MIYKDISNYPLSNTIDGGDSCVRASLIKICKHKERENFVLKDYLKNGLGVRHPSDTPWDNPLNFTRDQLLPLVAALYGLGYYKEVRSLFWSHMRRCFFGQNFQRDFKGTWKFPWPHKVRDFQKTGSVVTFGKSSWRMFDFADPIWWPDHLWHMIKGGRMYPLYFVGIIGIPLLWTKLYLNTLMSQKNNELNQIFSQAVVAGEWAKNLFKETRDLEISLYRYWGTDRNEIEYAEMILEDL